jgi:drug/metabolite transporter (DMT)-like permease
MNERLRGVLFVLGAAIAWSSGGLGVKLIDAPALAIAGYRSLFAAVVLGFAMVRLATRTGLGTGAVLRALARRRLLWGASLGYALMVVSFVIATKLTTAANAILIQYSAPIYVAARAAALVGLARGPWLHRRPAALLQRSRVVVGPAG